MNWINKPYPLVQNIRDKLFVVLGFGIATYVFLVVYQPFGAQDIQVNRYMFLLGFGGSVSLSLSITYFLLPRLLPRTFDALKWTVGAEVIYLIVSFLLVSVSNYYYNTTFGIDIAPQHTLFEFVGITTAVGILPLIIFIFQLERTRAKKNIEVAETLSQEINTDHTSVISFTICSEVQKEQDLELTTESFLYAQSDNIYTKIYYLNDGKVHSALLRITMKNLEAQLEKVDMFIRVHKSYLINQDMIISFEGNARSLSVRLKNVDVHIPVSRAMASKFLKGPS